MTRRVRRYTKYETTVLLWMFNEGYSIYKICRNLNRSQKSIRNNLIRLGKMEGEITPKRYVIELDAIGMTWKELKEEILNAHKPIKDLFFKGLGSKLQFEDSCIAESVMLQFANTDAPALPIHDSFAMDHGYGDKGGLEEAMRRAYFERFDSTLSEKRDLVEKVIHDKIRLDEDKKVINNDNGTIKVDDIINADSEYSEWRDRDRMWMSGK